jgi:hypothetical protein
MTYSNKQNSLICCQNKWQDVQRLPFSSNLYFGFYDGPIEGITLCPICQQCYYYKAIDYVTNWYCRIFSFSNVGYDFFGLVKYFNVTIEINNRYYCIPYDIDDTNNIISDLSVSPNSHICVADAYIQYGVWMEWLSSFDMVSDWYDYFGIIVDKKSGNFRLNRKLH